MTMTHAAVQPIGGRVESRDIAPVALKVDPTTQRGYSVARAKKMAAEWDPSGVGALHVSDRGPSGIYVVDGQHRRGAAILAGQGNVPVQCVVHHGLTLDEEAKLFNLLNTSVAVSPFDHYRVGLVAQDPTCTGIAAVLDIFGLRIDRSKSAGCIQAVQLIENIYFGLGMGVSGRRGKDPKPEHLESVLRVLYRAWGDDTAAYGQSLLYGVARVVGGHGTALDHDRLVQRLLEGGMPINWISRAHGRSTMMSVSSKKAMVGLMEEGYNKGLSRNRLKPLTRP